MPSTILTLQANGSATTESASVVPTTTGFMATGDLSGNGTEASKYGTPTLGSLNWTSGQQVFLVFNADEGGTSVTFPANSIQLSLYNGTTPIAGATLTNSAAITIPSTQQGVGQSGFVFGLTSSEQALLNTLIFNQPGFANFKVGLAATINDVSGGPETFSALLSTVPIPSSALLLGSGLVGLGLLCRRKKKPILLAG